MGTNLTTMSEMQATYSVFTGTDIYTVFQNQIISTMQGISYSITRQKAPIYTMGSPDPRSIARSKRGIAGSMIMTTFDRHSLADFMKESSFAAKKHTIETNPTANPIARLGTGLEVSYPSRDVFRAHVQTLNPNDISDVYANPTYSDELTAIAGGSSIAMSELATPMFTDQLLPFDTTLVGANEYGGGATLRIWGIEILNEGSGVSIDDTSNEVQMTYIARLISPWVKHDSLSNTSVPTEFAV